MSKVKAFLTDAAIFLFMVIGCLYSGGAKIDETGIQFKWPLRIFLFFLIWLTIGLAYVSKKTRNRLFWIGVLIAIMIFDYLYKNANK